MINLNKNPIISTIDELCCLLSNSKRHESEITFTRSRSFSEASNNADLISSKSKILREGFIGTVGGELEKYVTEHAIRTIAARNRFDSIADRKTPLSRVRRLSNYHKLAPTFSQA